MPGVAGCVLLENVGDLIKRGNVPAPRLHTHADTKHKEKNCGINIMRLYTLPNRKCNFRVEICRDCHDRRSCKIYASCVNFPKNKAISRIICQELKDLHISSVILHGNC